MRNTWIGGKASGLEPHSMFHHYVRQGVYGMNRAGVINGQNWKVLECPMINAMVR
jgi:hypothetical protein